ncbi:MAG: DinB family protein [Pseudomonadota bacterium]
MTTPDQCRLMARYNAWQNRSLIVAADGLDDLGRWLDRGAFFGSIAATLNHLLHDDALWLARFAGDPRPEDTLPTDPAQPTDWAAYKAKRVDRDAQITIWAQALTPADLAGTLAFHPGGGPTRVEKPRALCAAHLFNHQTHHRGQVHAMLTAAGARPAPTDLAAMG